MKSEWPSGRNTTALKSNDALWRNGSCSAIVLTAKQQEIAARVGLSRPQATNTIRGRFGVSRSIVRRVLELAKVA